MSKSLGSERFSGTHSVPESKRFSGTHSVPERVYSIKNNGNVIWYMGNRIHRSNDLPAVEYENGDREWWHNGALHRNDNRPAIERVNGYLEWWEHGRLIKSLESTFPIV